MEGTIKKLDKEKGFGFITPTGGDKDVFLHRSALVDVDFNNLQVGDKVTFDKQDDARGPKAGNVTLVQ